MEHNQQQGIDFGLLNLLGCTTESLGPFNHNIGLVLQTQLHNLLSKS